MLLDNLQSQLEAIYEIESQHRVHDFVIHDSQLAAQLDTSDNPRELPEKLLIHQDGEYVDLALYLDAQTMRLLEEHDPITQLNEDNIHEFWTVLEGVSHFLYLTYNAAYDRGVSLFELELQAEVDKYILAVSLLNQQGSELIPHSLHHHLFKRAEFDNRLNEHEFQRYYQANELASRFAAFIERCLHKRISGSRISNTLRRFYRLTQRQKIHNIMQLDA